MNENVQSLTFEQSLERLEVIVRELESNSIGLDQSLVRYEQGVSLLRHCREILDQAERRIRLLTGVDAAGNPITEECDGSSTLERVERELQAREPNSKSGRSTGRTRPRTPEPPANGGERLF